MLANQLEDAWVDRRPDAAPRPLLLSPDHRRWPAVVLRPALQVGHIFNRNLDRDLQLLDPAGVDDVHGAVGAAQETRRLTQRALRRG